MLSTILRWLASAYNLFKSDFETGPDAESQAEVALCHPRRDVWEQHFGVNEGAAIVGITPVGRATVVRLQMNRSLHITAHRRWRELGLFP